MKPSDTDLEALFNRLADGLASPEDEERLGDLLRNEPAVRQAYREFMALHSALHWDYVAAVTPAESSPVPAAPLSTAARGIQAGWFVAFVAGALAASIVAIALQRRDPSTIADAPGLPVPPAPVAPSAVADVGAGLLVDEVEARFADGRAPNGVQFGPGEYELLQGIIRLRFARGADVIVASPARFDVRDAQHIQLARGKIRVTAPPTAKGFTVATREASYVDLGTEFGLRVDPRSGASDLYVFDGQVNVTDPRSGKVWSQVVEGNSSRRVGGVGQAAPKLEENEFPTPGAIGFERWREHERTLRQDSQLLAYFPFLRGENGDELVNTSSAPLASPGRIVGARWTSGRWPGKNALLFDRDDDFVQIEIPGEHLELTIAAWLKVERLDFELNAILNSDGADLGDVHFQLNRQGLPRGGVVVSGGFREKVEGHRVPLGRWTHVASVMSVPSRSQKIYVNGVLARERSLRGDEVIRPGSCRLGSWLADARSGMVNRSFRGRMDEVAIWNRALSADEIVQQIEAGRPGLLWNEE